MKLFTATLASVLALGVAAGPLCAQAPATSAAPAKPVRQLKLSDKAQGPIAALQTAVKAKNTAAIPALLAAAQAAAKTPDDRYGIASLQLQSAIDANDYAGLVTAADVMMANGGTPAETNKIYVAAASKLAEGNQLAPAIAAVDKAIAGDPNNGDLYIQRSDYQFKQKQIPESLASLTTAIAKTKASGQPVPENWYHARTVRAYQANLPAAYGYSREWVAIAPTTTNWHDTIAIYRNLSQLDRTALVDMLRLARATKSLTGDADYGPWAESLIARGYPVEALALLQEGSAAGSIKLTSPQIAPIFTTAKAKAPGERGVMAQVSKMALGDPNARTAMRAGDGAFDAGDYAQAVTLYRAALGKAGVDRNLANLRLGMALAMAGDKAGATTSLQAVTGTQSEVAQYWLTYLAAPKA